VAQVGYIDAIFRYPIKSMAGEPLAEAEVGWHGIDGDRRFALRRVGETGGKPWLTASKLAELVRFTPVRRDGATLPTHVRTPEGVELSIGDELAAEIARRHGRPVEVMRLDHGIFDETPISVITAATIDAIAPDVRRFRPNIFIRTDAPRALEEDDWVGSVLAFGDGGPELAVTMRDERCAMLNIDPDSARIDPNVMKTVVRLNGNTAGVYATVLCRGRLVVGQRVSIERRA
jgi:MOSC domain-containing protein